jgi:hypothetical protein
MAGYSKDFSVLWSSIPVTYGMWSAYSTYEIQFYQRIGAFRVDLAIPRLFGSFEMRFLIRYSAF